MRILVSPLDWGLGHATRDIPIIRILLDKGHEVVLAGDGGSLTLLSQEFPELETIRLPASRITYSTHLPAWLKIILTSPHIAFGSLKEHRRLERVLRKYDIDFVISDNRYGLWTKKVPCVIISHQLSIRMPRFLKWMESAMRWMIRLAIRRFDSCWIPDYPGEHNLSGTLSHDILLPEKSRFIGTLSRFESIAGTIIPSTHKTSSEVTNLSKDTIDTYPIVAVVSGPEPQRSIFEKILFEQLKDYPLPSLIIGGQPQKEPEPGGTENCRIASHLPSDQMQKHLQEAKYIICRSGYSSIMDLVTLGKTAVLVPTPGQTEQEYLAERMQGKGWFASMSQKKFNLKTALAALDDPGSGPGFPLPDSEKEHKSALETALQQLRVW